MRAFIPLVFFQLIVGSTIEPGIDELDRLLEQMEGADPFLTTFDEEMYKVDETSEESSLSASPVSPALKRARIIGDPQNMRTIVIEELLKDIQTDGEVMQGRMFSEIPQDSWLSLKEINRMKYDVARPLVQPVILHDLLAAYKEPVSIDDPEMIAYLRANLSGQSAQLYTPDILRQIAPVWMKWCITPLAVYNAGKANLTDSAEPPCFLNEIEIGGVTKRAVVLNKKNQRLYLQQALESEREYLRSLIR
jgi:hypothetical protein